MFVLSKAFGWTSMISYFDVYVGQGNNLEQTVGVSNARFNTSDSRN